MVTGLGGASQEHEVRTTFFQNGALPIPPNQFMLGMFSTIERR